MTELFSKQGKQHLKNLPFHKTLYAFDFDGTLAKIVENPSAAYMNQSTTRLLKQLSQRVTVAIISGRSIPDLASRVQIDLKHLIGNHGLEGLPSFTNSLQSSREIASSWKRLLSTQIQPFNGNKVQLEDKCYSLTIHYQNKKKQNQINKNETPTELLEMIQKLQPSPRVVLGKSVINLLPPQAPHKGTAILELMNTLKLDSALFIGDDDTDEDVFSLQDPRILSIRVGQVNSTQAQYYIKTQTQIDQLLELILLNV